MSTFVNKNEARKWAKKLRSALSNVNHQICQHLEKFLVNKKAKTVLSYHAFGNEIKLDALISLPMIWATTRTETFSVHLWSTATIYQKGLLEPPADAPMIDIKEIDVALIPGLAFDRYGYRLGYGLGYYDRLLKSLPNIPLVGITHDDLLVEALPHDPWDIKMTHIATESGVFPVIKRQID